MALCKGSYVIRLQIGLIIALSFLLSLPRPIYGSVCQSICDCQAIEEEYVVHCSHKSLTSIPKDVPTQATQLDMSFNNVTSIVAGDVTLRRLRRLDLRSSNVRVIASGAFLQWPQLREIDLDHNSVELIEANTFKGLSDLTTLTLDHNAIRTVKNFAFQGLRTERLNLQHNENLTEIQDGAFWNSSIKTLLLDRCKLRFVSSMALKSLKHDLKSLMLSNNEVNLTLPEDIFSGFDMDRLHLSNDGISHIGFLKASTLTVREVLLEHNLLNVFDLSAYHGLSKTEILGLKNSSLTKLLRSSTLTTMSNLRSLDLSHNSLTVLHENTFAGIDTLERLYLQHNQFTTLPEELLGLVTGLEYMDLTGVPLGCDCRLEWLRHVVMDDNNTIVTGATCSYPTKVSFSDSTEPFTCVAPSNVRLEFTPDRGDDVTWLSVACVATGNPQPEVQWSVSRSEESKVGELVMMNGASSTSDQPPVNSCYILRCNARNLAGNVTGEFPLGSCRQSLPQTPHASCKLASPNKNALIIGLCLALLVIVLAVFLGLAVKYRSRLQNKCTRHSSRSLAARCTVGSEVNLLPNVRSPSHEDSCHMWNWLKSRRKKNLHRAL